MNNIAPHEGILLKQLKEIFPSQSTHIHARKVTNIKFPHSGAYVELDIWIPNLNLSFEFQDPHHYITTWYTAKSLESIQKRDHIKEGLIRKKGITLVVIPCWWDGDRESLEAEISFYRPDLYLQNNNLPISLNPRRSLQSFSVPGVGELMSALFPVDANFSGAIPSNTWWLGEKYDGVRFCFNPNLRKAYTRFCNQLVILPKIIAKVPKLFIDGEIWFGRGGFSLASNLANQYDQINWELLRLISFDVAGLESRKKPFEERYATLILQNIKHDEKAIIVAPRLMCPNTFHLKFLLQQVIENEGEGVILRKKGSMYVNGKSDSLIKFKSSQAEKEAIVVAVKEKGVQVALPCNTNFVIPSSDVLVPTPSVGDVVTFSFENRARREIPLNPQLIKIRTDIVWEEVVLNFQKEKIILNKNSHKVPGLTTHPNWSLPVARLFLEKFVKMKKLNPLLPESYYKLYPFLIQSAKGRTFLHKFKGGYIPTLQRLFPELKFDQNAFYAKWMDVRNRRKVFEDFAYHHRFDPLLPNNWYLVPVSKLLSVKGIATVITYHDQSVHKALLALFPEIGLDPSKLVKNYETTNTVLLDDRRVVKAKISPEKSSNIISRRSTSTESSKMNKQETKSEDWTKEKVRRNFFVNYALEMGFNPENATNWYSQNFSRMLSRKGAPEICAYHNFSLRKALLDLFPDIGLETAKLIKSTWSNEDRKMFFEDYAKSKGFDPLNPTHWYSQSLAPIMDLPGVTQVIKPFGRSIRKSLVALFPSIGLDLSKFYRYEDVENRKRFFGEYAKRNGFDPLIPNHWYSVPLTHILAETGGQQIVGYYNHSVKQALVSLFPNIGLDLSKFSPSHIIPEEKSKRFFENFAKENRFDPDNPENWYSQSLRKIISSKGVSSIMTKYNGNIQKALLETFPHIGIDPMKFRMTV